MADFSQTITRCEALETAGGVHESLRTYYTRAKSMQAMLQRYGTDAEFRAAVDYVYTPEQLAEIGAMFVDIDNLAAAWEANHRSALGLE